MTPADLHALKVAALNLSETVRRAETLPLLARGAAAMDAAKQAAGLFVRVVGVLEFLAMCEAARARESGGASTCEANDNGQRG